MFWIYMLTFCVFDWFYAIPNFDAVFRVIFHANILQCHIKMPCWLLIWLKCNALLIRWLWCHVLYVIISCYSDLLIWRFHAIPFHYWIDKSCMKFLMQYHFLNELTILFDAILVINAHLQCIFVYFDKNFIFDYLDLN